MGKSKKQKKVEAEKKKIIATKERGISKRGKRTIIIGVLTAAAGFFILTFADRYGDNWASHISPFVIIIGYVLIGVGIILPDKKNEAAANQSSPQINIKK